MVSQLKKKEILGNQVHSIGESPMKVPLLARSVFSMLIGRLDGINCLHSFI